MVVLEVQVADQLAFRLVAMLVVVAVDFLMVYLEVWDPCQMASRDKFKTQSTRAEIVWVSY